MNKQVRVWKVLMVLLVSMTSGAIVLMLLGNNAPSAGAFSLSSYYRLVPMSEVTATRVIQHQERWDHIEVHYSGTRAGNINSLAEINGLTDPVTGQLDPKQLNCHFVICNGLGGIDGQIQATERWLTQQSVQASSTLNQTIIVCIIADGRQVRATDSQVKRLEGLLETLTRQFDIPRDRIGFPLHLFEN